MAPTPKPPGQRVRRNLEQPKWRSLPAEGSGREAPPLPRKPKGAWLKTTREWWRTLWAAPMAAAYLEADVEPLVRLAMLKDEVARGRYPSGALAAIQQLEDRYGLSPKARRALQWEVSQARAAAEGDPAQQAAPAQQRPTGEKSRARLRVVDPQAAAG